MSFHGIQGNLEEAAHLSVKLGYRGKLFIITDDYRFFSLYEGGEGILLPGQDHLSDFPRV